MEEGEEPPGPQLDVQKIIEYPGFTVETGPDIVDVCVLLSLCQFHKIFEGLILLSCVSF